MKHSDGKIHFAVTVIGKDRPGIVADSTEVLFRLGCNIEDSSCTMLAGEFAMILIVSHSRPFSKVKLSEEFRTLAESGLSTSVRTLADEEVKREEAEGDLCVITVYGSDKPGIVYSVTRELSSRKINITDLNTKLVGTEEEPVYVLILEAVLPEGETADTVSILLESLRNDLGVEISVRNITPVAF